MPVRSRGASTSAASASCAGRRAPAATTTARTISSPARHSGADGYRDHSGGDAERGNANFGYRITPDVETRFYLNANRVRQRIPGEVTKYTALNDPQAAWSVNVRDDWQRNIDTVRVANKTTMRFGETTIEVGAFANERHLMHPIFQWLDYTYHDYGALGRLVDDRFIWGHRNYFVAGVNVLNGTINAKQYVNTGGAKGAPMSDLVQKPQNYSAYLENSFYVLPGFALVAGTQYLFAVRDQAVNFSLNGDQPGRNAWSLWSPKVGFLWDLDPNVAGVRQHLAQRRSAELRRERRAELPPAQPAEHPVVRHQGADRHHLRDRHARSPARLLVGCGVLPRRRSERADVLLQLVRQLQRHQRGQDDASGHRSSAAASRCGRRCGSMAPIPTASGSTSPGR